MISGISEHIIKAGASAESFKRGAQYAANGSVLSVTQRGMGIMGKVSGSWDTPYRVNIRVASGSIQHADCSCPYNWGGWCKHIVAVLLTYIQSHDEVKEVGEIESRLQNMSKDQLVALVARMVDQHEDLEFMIDSAAIQHGDEVDKKSIKARVKDIYQQMGHEWGAAREVAVALDEIQDTGILCADAGRWEQAANIYLALIAGIFEGYDFIDDENGDVLMVINSSAELLMGCLEHVDDKAQRKEILATLVEIFLWDVMMGGIGVGEFVPEFVAEQVNKEERALVIADLRQSLPRGNPENDDFAKSWNRKTIGEFLLLLEGELYDDETFLTHCRQTGNWIAMIDRLLALDRIEEAVTESASVTGQSFIELIDVFENRGHFDKILALVRARARTLNDEQLAETLKAILEEKGDIVAAQEWSEWLFWRHKSLQRFDDLKRLAMMAGEWDTQSRDVEARLKELDADDLLTEIYLREGAYEDAITSLNNVIDGAREGWGAIPHYDLIIKVIGAIEEAYPEEAIRLHGYLSEQYIELRGRENYASAVHHLSEILKLYDNLGRTADGFMVIDDMKAIHANLRAFLEELDKAGL